VVEPCVVVGRPHRLRRVQRHFLREQAPEAVVGVGCQGAVEVGAANAVPSASYVKVALLPWALVSVVTCPSTLYVHVVVFASGSFAVHVVCYPFRCQ